MIVYFLIYDLDNGRLANVHKLTYKGKMSSIRKAICAEYWIDNKDVEVRIFDHYRQIYRNNARNFAEIADYVQMCYEQYGYKEFFEN